MKRAAAQKQHELELILSGIMDEGQYEAALLADSDGLCLAAVTKDHVTADMVAAMSGLLRNAAIKARRHLGLEHIDELALQTDDYHRLICRFFQIQAEQPLSLTVLVAPGQAYRRATNKAITAIKNYWAIS